MTANSWHVQLIKRNQTQPYKWTGSQPRSPWRFPPFSLYSPAPLPLPEPRGIKHSGFCHGDQSEIPGWSESPGTLWANHEWATWWHELARGLGLSPKPWYREFRCRGCASRTLRGLLMKPTDEQQAERNVPGSGSKSSAKNHRITECLGVGGTEKSSRSSPLPWTRKSLVLFSQKWNLSRFRPKSGVNLSTAQWAPPAGRETPREWWQSSIKRRFTRGKRRRGCYPCGNTWAKCNKWN